MAMVLHHFEIFPDEDNPPIKDLSIILRPSPGLSLKLKCRNLHSSPVWCPYLKQLETGIIHANNTYLSWDLWLLFFKIKVMVSHCMGLLSLWPNINIPCWHYAITRCTAIHLCMLAPKSPSEIITRWGQFLLEIIKELGLISLDWLLMSVVCDDVCDSIYIYTAREYWHSHNNYWLRKECI